MFEDWQKEDKLTSLLDEIDANNIPVFVEIKIKDAKLTRYVGAFLPKCESDDFSDNQSIP